MKCFCLALFLVLLVNVSGFAADKDAGKKKDDPMASSQFSGLKFRSVGPAVTSGRIIDFAVNPKDRSQYYAAAASGGVWKTTNAGTTWTPVFDSEGSYSIGCITMDPNNSNVIWVGTGENNSQRSVAYGDGVYRSDNGGRSWKNMGLSKSEHIGRIIIDPRNSNVIYVAAQGPLWNAGGERGVYKSSDGGATWKAVLTISENTGANEVIFDPRNPDVLYASSYQRRRHVYTIIDGGPESAIYKSTDAGSTWEKLTTGLPNTDMGKIGLAVSPAEPDYIYAVIEAMQGKGGFFRSTDRGATWEKRSGYFSGSAQYYNEIFCDPKDPDRVYAMDTYNLVTDDGGKTFKRLGEKSKHVDNHALWIDPENTNYYLSGCDGGVYESFDRGQNWNFKSNLPVAQFYRVAVDNTLPFYYIYGGTQDNFSLGGPSQTINASGIVNSDWFVTQGGDGFYSRIDPEDPNIVYAESQYGGLVRYDRKSGEAMGIKPQEMKGEEPLRWNWDSPLIISPHSHSRLYFAANKLFRSDDRGNSWKQISGDLSRQMDRNKLPVMGRIWSSDAVAKNASTSFYGNIVALTESPVKEGLIYAGTDDGLINITRNGGADWEKIEKLPGVPEFSYISCLLASQHNEGTVYAACDNHKTGDFAPYILKSVDGGKSWTSIKANLPERGTVYTIAEDFINPKLLFAGTEYGVFFTVDGGNKWVQLKEGLPVIAIKDIAIQKRESDLVLATFGRGFYVLDNFAPLREVTPALLEKEAFIFTPKDAYMFIKATPIGSSGKGFLGESFYTADNPPFGAAFTYFLKETVKTKKQLRQEREAEAVKKGETIKYPTNEELSAEDKEEEPYLSFLITDQSGNPIRTLRAPAVSGIKRITWDLRYPPLSPAKLTSGEEEGQDNEEGMMALPGDYKVSISRVVNGAATQICPPVSFKALPLGTLNLPASDRAALADFQKKLLRLRNAVQGLQELTKGMAENLKLIKQALKNTPAAPASLSETIKKMEDANSEIVKQLSGDYGMKKRNENTPPSIGDRLELIISDQWQSTQAPTKSQVDAYNIAAEEFAPVLEKFRKLSDEDMKGLSRALDEAGAPWTPGRMPKL
ncbi:MAG: WD40/YVTN/BNR-like repeat-containing protein [Syntrophothermus sp.]